MGPKAKGLGGWWIALLLSAASLAAPIDLRLVEAVKKGDRVAVRSLLKQQVDVNAPQADGATALHWAADRDDLETGELLIRAGANVNAATDYGRTPLSKACERGNGAMVEKLMKAGANTNTALLSGETALMTCVRTGNLDAVKSLLARGANVNAKETRQGQTALMWAAAAKYPEIVGALIEHGADVHARSKSGLTALLFAAQEGDLKSAKLLLAAGADANEAMPVKPCEPKEIRKGENDIVAVEGPQPPARCHRGLPEGMTAFLLAAASGHEELAAFLLDHGADPNAADVYGFTALHYAAWQGKEELAKALLARGANPNARLVNEPPVPLIRVLGGSRWTSVASAQGTALDKDGSPSLLGATPVWLAAQAGDVRLIRVLVANGADPLIPTEEGSTPLMAAAGVGRLIPWREENWVLARAEGRSTSEAVKLLFELGSDVNAVGQNGWTALHGAAYTAQDDIIRFLVEKGAKMDVLDRFGQTPLSIAGAIPVEGLTRPGVHYVLFAGRVFSKSTFDLLLELGATPLEASGVKIVSAFGGKKLDEPLPEAK